MKKHPAIKYLYVLFSLTPIGLLLYGFSYDVSKKFASIVEFKNMYISLVLSSLLIMLAVSIAGFLSAKVKGVAQYAFYLVFLLLLPIPSMWYYVVHCNGKFCGIGNGVFSYILFGLAIGTISVYYIGKFLAKRGYLPKFIKFLYILAFGLFVIVTPFYIATEFFRFDYARFDYIFKPWFDNLNLDWLSTYISSFMSIATVTIPALIFAIYPLKIAEAEYEDNGGVVNKNN